MEEVRINYTQKRQILPGDSEACKIHLGRKNDPVITNEDNLPSGGVLAVHRMMRRLSQHYLGTLVLHMWAGDVTKPNMQMGRKIYTVNNCFDRRFKLVQLKTLLNFGMHTKELN